MENLFPHSFDEYQTQTDTEATLSKRNIPGWIADEIATINPAAIEVAVALATSFLEQIDDLEQVGRNSDIKLNLGEEAPKLIVNALLQAVIGMPAKAIMVKGKARYKTPTMPLQSLATQIGLKLHDDRIDAVLTGSLLLAAFKEIGLYKAKASKDDEGMDTVIIIQTIAVSQDLRDRIRLTQYLPPMVIQPEVIKKASSALVLGGRENYVGQELNLKTINKLQSVAWEINLPLFKFLKDEMKVDENNPKRKTRAELDQEKQTKKQFIARQGETNKVINYLVGNGNKFWFKWTYDKRGRMYSAGYHINPQGNEYRKAMLNFSYKEKLTKVGKLNLRYDIANTYGADKETWSKRLFIASRIISDCTQDMRSFERKVKEYAQSAGDKLLFIKAMFAWREGVVRGNAIGHNMGFDATASGLQLMGAMAGCTTTATNSNVNLKSETRLTDDAQARLAELEAQLALLD